MRQHATAIQLFPAQTRARAKKPAVSLHRHVSVDTLIRRACSAERCPLLRDEQTFARPYAGDGF